MEIEQFKMKVTSEENRVVQETLFSYGYTWGSSSTKIQILNGISHLYFENNKLLQGNTESYFITYKLKELTFKDFMFKYVLMDLKEGDYIKIIDLVYLPHRGLITAQVPYRITGLVYTSIDLIEAVLENGAVITVYSYKDGGLYNAYFHKVSIPVPIKEVPSHVVTVSGGISDSIPRNMVFKTTGVDWDESGFLIDTRGNKNGFLGAKKKCLRAATDEEIEAFNIFGGPYLIQYTKDIIAFKEEGHYSQVKLESSDTIVHVHNDDLIKLKKDSVCSTNDESNKDSSINFSNLDFSNLNILDDNAEFRVIVVNPEQSEKVQKILFKLGAGWLFGDEFKIAYLSSQVLYCRKKVLTHNKTVQESDLPTLTYEDFFKLYKDSIKLCDDSILLERKDVQNNTEDLKYINPISTTFTELCIPKQDNLVVYKINTIKIK